MSLCGNVSLRNLFVVFSKQKHFIEMIHHEAEHPKNFKTAAILTNFVQNLISVSPPEIDHHTPASTAVRICLLIGCM